MIEARIGTRTLLAALAVVALAGCGSRKETGPDEGAPQDIPEVATPVPPAIADPAAARPLASFAGMDADADGFVASAEHAQASQTMFRMMDADKDGAVTVIEMDAAQEALGFTDALSSEKKIATIDSDNDGKLTLGEHVAGSNGIFAKMDANADGKLDRPEWDAGHAGLTPSEKAKPAAR